MMKQIRRKIFRGLCLLLLLQGGIFVYRHVQESTPRKQKPQWELQTFQWQDGWGYKVMLNHKVLIYQPTIPAIDSLCAFPSEASARRIGNRVLERIKHNQNFSLTQEEIKQILSDR